jgi:hypothetical protein
MVNKKLANLDVRLDNFGAKPLKLQTPNRCMVVDAAPIEPVSTLKFPASREFSREFFEKRTSEGDSRI